MYEGAATKNAKTFQLILNISVLKKLANFLIEIFENFVFVLFKNINFSLLSPKLFIALKFIDF